MCVLIPHPTPSMLNSPLLRRKENIKELKKILSEVPPHTPEFTT